MALYPKSANALIEQLSRLPGVGRKTAQRLAFHLMRMSKSDVESFAQTMVSVKSNILFCIQCQNISENNPCAICSNPKRDSSRICIVEDPLDVIALERANCYEGKYHILHGVISPMNGITPEDIKIKELLEKIKTNTLNEIIIATNPTVEGEATAMYIQKIISPLIDFGKPSSNVTLDSPFSDLLLVLIVPSGLR